MTRRLYSPIVMIAAAIAAVVALAGCAIGPWMVGPSNSGPSRVVLDASDVGHHVNVHRGDTVELQLQDKFPIPGSSTVWDATSTSTAVLSCSSSVHEAPSSIAHTQALYTADFTAVGSGNAQIQIVGSNTCEAMDPAYCRNTSLPAITVTVS